MKKIKDFNLKEKNVLVRCDLNVPLSKDKKVLDSFRIKSILPTIKYLIKQKARVLIIGHLEKRDQVYSFDCLIPELEKILDQKVFFISDYLNKNSRQKIEEKVGYGEVALLENLRFHKGEKKNSHDFAKKLSRLGDIFVNNAFSVCHRKHASIVGLPEFLPSTAGFLVEKELKNLSKLLKNIARPFVVIIGGIKVKKKGRAILNSLRLADKILIGSKIEEFILNQKNILDRENLKEYQFLEKIDLDNEKIVHPVDGLFALNENGDKIRIGSVKGLKKNEKIFDIGPKTIKNFQKIIKSAKTILWSGPIGMFEKKLFENGTKGVAEAVVENEPSFSVAGGGETISFIRKFNLSKNFDFLSTGGGAMLGLLDKKGLPGIKALKYYD